METELTHAARTGRPAAPSTDDRGRPRLFACLRATRSQETIPRSPRRARVRPPHASRAAASSRPPSCEIPSLASNWSRSWQSGNVYAYARRLAEVRRPRDTPAKPMAGVDAIETIRRRRRPTLRGNCRSWPRLSGLGKAAKSRCWLRRLHGRADRGELIGGQGLLREQQAGPFIEIGAA